MKIGNKFFKIIIVTLLSVCFLSSCGGQDDGFDTELYSVTEDEEGFETVGSDDSEVIDKVTGGDDSKSEQGDEDGVVHLPKIPA